jgi:hypothetical protein
MPPRGEGRPFIPPAELGGILAYFDKEHSINGLLEVTNTDNVIIS